MSPAAPDALSKDDLEEIIELTDVIEEGPELAGDGAGFEDELASLLDEPSAAGQGAQAKDLGSPLDLTPPESPSAGRATSADLDELDDLFADLEKPANAAAPGASAAGPADIESMLADIRAHAEPAGDEAADTSGADLDHLLAGLEEAATEEVEETAAEEAVVEAAEIAEEDQDLAAILGELESATPAAEPQAPAMAEAPAGPEAGPPAAPRDDLDALLTAGLGEDESGNLPAAESPVRPATAEAPAEPAAGTALVDEALLADLRSELAALREAQATLGARLETLAASESHIEPPDSAALLGQALGEGSPLFADLARRLGEELAPRLQTDFDTRLDSSLDTRLQDFGSTLRAQTLSELQDSLPPPSDPAALIEQALAEGSPLFAELCRRLAEELAPRLQDALNARLESAIAGQRAALAGDLARDLKAELTSELTSEITAEIRAELETLVPEAAARVIREEITALAEDASEG